MIFKRLKCQLTLSSFSNLFNESKFLFANNRYNLSIYLSIFISWYESLRVYIYQTPPQQAECDTKSRLKCPVYATVYQDWFIRFSRVLVWSEMQIVSFRSWNRMAEFISYDDNLRLSVLACICGSTAWSNRNNI